MATTNYLDLTGLTTYDGLIKTYVDTNVNSVQDELNSLETLVGAIPDGYTATTVTAYAKELADNVAANGYDDTELQTTVAGKADKATTLAGYGITDAYTKTDADTAIATAVANAEHLKRSIVDTLPDVADADVHTIYMKSITDGSGYQKYEEFILINGMFEKIGDSAVDLTDYATKTEVATAKSEANTYADGLAVNYDAAGSATEAQTNAQTYADTKVKELSDSLVAITEDEINALFTS